MRGWVCPAKFSARCAIVLACAGPLLAVSVPAYAAPPRSELSKARAKFQRASELEQAGNYAAALPLFRDVGEVKMTPQVRFHIAFCEENLGQLVAALGGYELASQEAEEVGGSFKTTVDAKIASLRERIPKLEIDRGKGGEAAQIELDGVALGTPSIGTAMPVDPGPHTVTAKAPGMNPFSKTVTAADKATATVTVEMTPIATPEATPVAATAPPPAKDEGPKKSHSLVVPLVVGGVGVASLAASGAFFLMKNSAISDLDAACGADRQHCPSDSQGTYDRAKTYNTVSIVTFGVGVVGVGVAATLLLTHKSSPAQESGLAVAPTAPGAAAGATLLGHF